MSFRGGTGLENLMRSEETASALSFNLNSSTTSFSRGLFVGRVSFSKHSRKLLSKA
jgi:hypothetical protein